MGDERKSPNMQWLVMCGKAEEPFIEDFVMPPLPFRARLLFSDDRLGGPEQHLDIRTSDEVAWQLVRLGFTWEVRQLA